MIRRIQGIYLAMILGFSLLILSCGGGGKSDNNKTDPPVQDKVSIQSPLQDEVYLFGSRIAFEGRAEDDEGNPITGNKLSWVSDVDGLIGNGAHFESDRLSRGAHTILFSAEDPDGKVFQKGVRIYCDNSGSVIISPQNDDLINVEETITFTGYGLDGQGNELLHDQLVWESSIDGEIGRGRSFLKKLSSRGVHTLTLTGTGGTGDVFTDQVRLLVGVGEAFIDAPKDGDAFITGTPVTFSGHATDAAGNEIPDNLLSWQSDKDGLLGTGKALTTQGLTQGMHTITLTATDAAGYATFRRIRISVDQARTFIDTPKDAGEFLLGELITFTGHAVDYLGEEILDTALFWSSNVDGLLGTNGTLAIRSLSAGNHLITLSAEDAAGNKGSNQITVKVGNIKSVWLKLFDYEADEWAEAIALDGEGNLHVGMNTLYSSGSSVLVSYDANGNKRWESSPVFTKGTIDTFTHAIVTPKAGGSMAFGDLYYDKDTPAIFYQEIEKGGYNKSGGVAMHFKASNITPRLTDAVLDYSGSNYLVGSDYYNPGPGEDYLYVVKNSNPGFYTDWRYFFGNSKTDRINAITTDSNGNIYVTGVTGGNIDGNHPTNQNPSLFVAKLCSSCPQNETLSWIRQFPTTQSDEGSDILFDGDKNLYVTGTTLSGINGLPTQGGTDLFVMKLDSATGEELFTVQAGSIGDDRGKRLAFDSAKRLYLLGESAGVVLGQIGLGGKDILLARLNATDGAILWHSLIGGIGDDEPYDFAFSSANPAYVVGKTDTGFNEKIPRVGSDAFVLKLNLLP